ncbi:hypothetical protein Csa_023577, partial [Cucumis sativus]
HQCDPCESKREFNCWALNDRPHCDRGWDPKIPWLVGSL